MERWIYLVQMRLRSLFRREDVDRELNEELRDHVERKTEENIARGMPVAEARRAALVEAGGIELAKEKCRETRRVSWIHDLAQDVRFGFRMLRKNPGFTAVAVLMLALGIGANTALFSIVNGVLLNPLPYPHPKQLVTLHESKPNFPTGSISYPNFRDWQKENRTFSAMAIARGYAFSLTGRGEAESVRAEFVSSDFFTILGIEPIIGRTFEPSEDEIGGGAPSAIISGGFWKRKLGSTPSVIGETLDLDGRDYRIVGVIPENFDLLTRSFRAAEVYVPIGQWALPALNNRGAGLGIHGIGRLKAGVTIAQARADMDSVASGLAEAYPEVDQGIGASLVPLDDDMFGNVRFFLLVLLGAVGFVLLIACVNVANLFLARSTSRAREFAIRAALGAAHSRLVRQLLAESVIFAIFGGALGLLVAGLGVHVMLGLLPTSLPRAQEVGLDSRVLLFTMGISVLAGILFGLAPALKVARTSLQNRLRDGGRGASAPHQRTQTIFVIVEMAMTVVLLAGAGLMLRSFVVLSSVDPGFRADNVLTFGLTLPPSMFGANATAIRAALREDERTIKSIPDVESVAFSWGAFPMASEDDGLFWIAGQPKPTSEKDMNWTLSYVVGPDYLRVMGIPLERGRFFTQSDEEHSPAIAAIDDTFARKYFGNLNPIGRRINLTTTNTEVEIVGIVGHAYQWGLDSDATNSLRAQIYTPYMQLPDALIQLVPPGTTVAIRYRGSSASLFDAIRHDLQRLNSDNIVYSVQTMNEIISTSLAARRFSMQVLGFFGTLALLLSSIGIYGVVSYIVSQRTHEIGVRMALGGRPSDILTLILSRGAYMAAAGVGIGLLGAFALTRLIAKMLFGVSATDPVTFAGVSVFLVVVALVASYVPARRAMRVDPMVALRHD